MSKLRNRADFYGAGCKSGHALAQAWVSNQKRGDPRVGGTLQAIVLDLAQQFRDAKGESEISTLRGKIVGFCYAIECPDDAAKIREEVDKAEGGAA